MNSKTPLALIEMSIMILIFSLTAALCLKSFAWSSNTTKDNAELDKAVLISQSVAEELKQGGLVLDPAVPMDILFDADWQMVAPGSSDCCYILSVRGIDSGSDYLAKASFEVTKLGGGSIFGFEAAWQTGGAQ